ncbi:MAG: ribonuclease HII [Desulfobacteraceae bacterium]|nr:ribonuclease HII [Desulfobacteraceae bacterium]
MMMEAVGWKFERKASEKGYRRIAGIDEAGRGPLAGPVVAAAVILPYAAAPDGLNDSKKLSPKRRERLYDAIYSQALGVGIGIVDATFIDRINILQAALTAMVLAVHNLHPGSDFLLIDGNAAIPLGIPQKAIVRGDSRSASIAAASIVAKVTRDRLMQHYHLYYPEFDFPRHKGYPTRLHRNALRENGCCPIHRMSFSGVKQCRNC